MKKLLSIILALVLVLSMVVVSTVTTLAEETGVGEGDITTESEGTTENTPENENNGEDAGNTEDNTGDNENTEDNENTDNNGNTGENTDDGEGSDEVVDENAFKWVLDGTVLTISGKCEMPAFDEVPAEWGNEITEVIILDGITNISKSAFKDAALLTKVTMPSTVTKIDASAFEGCALLTEIVIPDSVSEIGESAFKLSGLQSVAFGIGLTYIGNGAFSGCEKLDNVYITYLNSWCNMNFGDEYSTPLAYAENLYHNDKLLTKVNIPEGVTEIKYGVFNNCTSIETITVPSTVTAIGKSAFVGCSALSKVTLSESVTVIGEDAFNGCESLKNVEFCEGLLSIESGAFRDCTALHTVELPKTLTTIGNNAFRGCNLLLNITIPEGVTSIGELAFADCRVLNRVTFPQSEITLAKDSGGNHIFANSNYVIGICYKESATAQYLTDCNITTLFADLPEENVVSGKVGKFEWQLDKITGLLQIDGEGEMMDFTYANAPWSEYASFIAQIKLSDDITYIGEKAFSGTFIFSLEIPESVERIGDYAFANSVILTDLIITDSVVRIDAFAFENCKDLKNITVGKGLEIIDYAAFGGCENIENVYIDDLTVWCNIDFEYFIFNQSNPLEFAQNLYVNNQLVTDLNIPYEAKQVSPYAFYRFENLQSVTFLGELESIGKSAFEGCNGITAVILPFNVEVIEANAFANCDGLKEVTVYNKAVELNNEIGFNNTQTFYGYAGTTVEAFATEIEAVFTDISETHEHKLRSATCVNPIECETCGFVVGEPLPHNYENVCDIQCDDCGHIRAPLHDYDNACDEECGVCGEIRSVPEHNYKKYKTTDATTSKNGKKYYECKECGKTKTSTIYKITKVELSTTSYTYNGKTKKPSVKIYDSKGNKLEYDVDYTYKRPSSSKKVGSYKIKVTFKGDYTGSTTLYYMINPPKTKVSEVTAGSKSLKVKISKKSEQVTGYQVQYSTSKSFANVGSKTITSYKTTSHTFKNLKAKKNYYIRVRTYKKVDGVIYYSAWSDSVKKKTK